MFTKFEHAPVSASSIQYKRRTLKLAKENMDAMAADFQIFRNRLRFLRAWNPPGVMTKDQILSMAIVKHLGKRDTMSYDAKYFPRDLWSNTVAYNFLRCVPKFYDNTNLSPPLSQDHYEQLIKPPSSQPKS